MLCLQHIRLVHAKNLLILGFSASYCTYVLMDLHGSKVVGLWVAQKHMVSRTQFKTKLYTITNQVKSSAEMEPYAAKSLVLNLAWDHDLMMDSITTDRSTSMRTMLE